MASVQNIGLNNEEKKGKCLKFILNLMLKIGILSKILERSYNLSPVSILTLLRSLNFIVYVSRSEGRFLFAVLNVWLLVTVGRCLFT